MIKLEVGHYYRHDWEEGTGVILITKIEGAVIEFEVIVGDSILGRIGDGWGNEITMGASVHRDLVLAPEYHSPVYCALMGLGSPENGSEGA